MQVAARKVSMDGRIVCPLASSPTASSNERREPNGLYGAAYGEQMGNHGPWPAAKKDNNPDRGLIFAKVCEC